MDTRFQPNVSFKKSVSKDFSVPVTTKVPPSETQVLSVFFDLHKVGCDFLSIGQYLAPSSAHFPVKEYILPEKFFYYKQKALELGFLYVASGPYVRSSYLASEYMEIKKQPAIF